MYHFSCCIPGHHILHLSCLEAKPTGLTGNAGDQVWRSGCAADRGGGDSGLPFAPAEPLGELGKWSDGVAGLREDLFNKKMVLFVGRVEGGGGKG